MAIDQSMIMLTGVLAAWINQDPRHRVRRWACLIGLVGQPFWLYANLRAAQWGMFVVTLGYTAAFLRGVHVSWLRVDCDG